MEYKELLGAVSAVIAAGISLSYIYTVVRGKTRPHVYTLLVDVIVSTVILVGAFIAGAGAGIWNLAVSTPLVAVLALLCIKYGTRDITLSDSVFLGAALFTVVPWILTKNPTLSIVLGSFIYVLSMLPTVRKTWNAPYSEPWTIWTLNALKHVIALAALTTFSVATSTYSISILIIDSILIGVILYRRKKLQTADSH